MQQHDTHPAAWLRAKKPSDVTALRTTDEGDEFVRAGCQAGLAGLLLEHVSRYKLPLAASPSLEAKITAALRRHALAVAANNMNISGELERLATAWEQADLPVMLLKGAALNLTVYKRPDLRPMSDVDLLVRPEAADEAARLLVSHGCRRGFALVRDGFFPKYHYEMELMTGSPRPVRIDLHARPFRPLRVSRTMSDDAFWEGARSIQVGTGKALIPSPEIMFIHLTAHAAFHGCSRLLWLYDIKRLVEEQGQTMDWSKVTQRARQWRLSLAVLRAIERSAELLGPVCPPCVLDELASGDVSWRDRLTLYQAPRDAASPVAHIVVNLLCTPGLRFRIGYLLAHLLPGRAHLADVYPYRHRGWVFCAHTWRSVRALVRIACAPWRGLMWAARSIA